MYAADNSAANGGTRHGNVQRDPDVVEGEFSEA
jgi:hypothetical protein